MTLSSLNYASSSTYQDTSLSQATLTGYSAKHTRNACFRGAQRLLKKSVRLVSPVDNVLLIVKISHPLRMKQAANKSTKLIAVR